jgi:hypothetical protein
MDETPPSDDGVPVTPQRRTAPLGHTAFSWRGAGAGAARPPCGHTRFSWRGERRKRRVSWCDAPPAVRHFERGEGEVDEPLPDMVPEIQTWRDKSLDKKTGLSMYKEEQPDHIAPKELAKQWLALKKTDPDRRASFEAKAKAYNAEHGL